METRKKDVQRREVEKEWRIAEKWNLEMSSRNVPFIYQSKYCNYAASRGWVRTMLTAVQPELLAAQKKQCKRVSDSSEMTQNYHYSKTQLRPSYVRSENKLARNSTMCQKCHQTIFQQKDETRQRL